MNADDPKFTAYALDELDPAERAAIEAELRKSPALAAEMEELQRFLGQLRGELHAEEGAPLAPEQRAAVLGLAPRIVAGPRAWWRRPVVQSAAAACVIVGVVATIFVRTEMKTTGGPFRGVPQKGMKLTLEPEPVKTDMPVDTDGLAVPVPAVATAKPVDAPSTLDMKFGHEASSPVVTSDPYAAGGQISPPASVTTPEGVINISGGGVLSPPPAESADAPSNSIAASRERLMNKEKLAAVEESQFRTRIKAGRALVPERGLATSANSTPVLKTDSPTFHMFAKADSSPKAPVPAELAPSNDMSTADPGPGLGAILGQMQTDKAILEKEVRSTTDKLAAARKQISAQRTAGRTDQVGGLKKEINEWETRLKTSKEQLAQLQETYNRVTAAMEPEPQVDAEAYDAITDNAFCTVREEPLSTFSIDVDTASYANVRRMLNANQRPPKGAVRIEELINYFRYEYPQPDGEDPFACRTEVATCPWQTEHRLARIGLKGRELKRESRPVANLVFLIDVSGSMQPENKLPLVKQSLRLLIDQLGAEDTVAIAVYAGNSGCVLEPTHDRNKMREALDRLEAGGSTNGASGIQLAYDLAQRSFKKGGSNRVILCTDGDFNVGITSQSELVSMIQGKAKTGIFLSVFGFGMGNYKDSTLEKLADKGNGNYGYIDTLAEGKKVFVEEMAGTLFTIAKDVKIQVEFNPARVAAYRLIGYENRMLAKEDFNDDKKDAGEIGAGHTVTALYEIVPAGKEVPGAPVVDDLKYQKTPKLAEPAAAAEMENREMLTVKVRYKQPDGEVSKKLEFPLTDRGTTWEKSSRDFRWAASVASFGLLLRDSPHKGTANWNMTLELAAEGKGDDRDGYRSEFVGLVEKAKALCR